MRGGLIGLRSSRNVLSLPARSASRAKGLLLGPHLARSEAARNVAKAAQSPVTCNCAETAASADSCRAELSLMQHKQPPDKLRYTCGGALALKRPKSLAVQQQHAKVWAG